LFKPLALFMAARYTMAKKRHGFVSFISLSSMLGIAFGVMVLITVLSVMNGFDVEIRSRFFSMTPEITIINDGGEIYGWRKIIKNLQTYDDVVAAAPFVSEQALLSYEGAVIPVVLLGIDPKYEDQLIHLKQKILVGSLDDIEHFGIVIGKVLAENLGVGLGDVITVMIPKAAMTPAGILPRFKRFTVRGIFSAGAGFNFDNKMAFIALGDGQKLLDMHEGVGGIRIKIKDIYKAPSLANTIADTLPENYFVSNWTQSFGEFFHAIKLEKTMMFVVLILIIAVAVFNLISSLVMLVHDKKAEIAILRTIGATPNLILQLFIMQGMIIGCCGTFMGVILGLLLAHNVTSLAENLQNFFGLHLISSNVHLVDFLPSVILWQDVALVGSIALGLSFLATIYPACCAAKTIIVEALHHD
jgi:lipoprotein-releasing system permease protein